MEKRSKETIEWVLIIGAFVAILLAVIGIFHLIGKAVEPEKIPTEKTKEEVLYDLTDKHIVDYVESGYWPIDHELSTGETFHDRIYSDDVPAGKYSEVMYRGPCDVRNMVKLWDESPTHKAVLDKEYQHGVLIYEPDVTHEGWCIAIMTVGD